MCDRIDTFLVKNCLSRDWLVEQIGVSHVALSRYVNGKRIPTKEIMQKIYEVTHGFVRPDHFYDLPVLQVPARGFVSLRAADEDRNGACKTQLHEKDACSCPPFSLPPALNDCFGSRNSGAEVSS